LIKVTRLSKDYTAMKQLHGSFSLLGAAAFSMLTFPAFANTATQQTGTQSAAIDGSNNQVIQIINQVNIFSSPLGVYNSWGIPPAPLKRGV
jgi:hypothetical protein